MSSCVAWIDTVITSPAFASELSTLLLDAIETLDSVGAVRSIVTELPSVTNTGLLPPTLPARSLKLIDTPAIPSDTPPSATTNVAA